ncbi:MAG: hypothetical protein JW781_07750 [Deltaproteobacteria bacterium]|nr:hypothetical protein [Candidatus Anaeroferrophillacea bacterium]
MTNTTAGKPGPLPPAKKHPCSDCRFCQWCSDDRCCLCRGGAEKGGGENGGGCRQGRKLSLAEQIALYNRRNPEIAGKGD